jgi:predicted permease
LLTESSLLAVCGAVVGVSVAALTLQTLVGLSPSDIPRLDATTLDVRVLGFALGMSVATTIVLGVAPAWLLSRPSLVAALKGPATGATADAGRTLFRQTLVTLQVAGTLVLLVATGLSIKSFATLARLDLGFNPTSVLTFSVKGLDESRYPQLDQRRQIIEQLLDAFKRIPQVVAAGALSQRPFENGQVGWDTRVVLEGQEDRPESWNRNPVLNWETVSGDYFQSMGIRLLRGRLFDARDASDAPPVVIVSEAMAARVWPGQDPIGKRLRDSFFEHASKDRAPRWQTVVGVVATARYREIENPRLDLYVPLRQGGAIQHFTVRTAIEPLKMAPTLGAAVTAVDRGLSIHGVTTMAEVVRRTRGPWQFTMRVFSIFGVVALALASIGLFSLVTYAVNQRTREIGVRMALGASRASVVRLLVSEAARPALVGVVIGLVAGVLVTRVLASLLFDTSPTDPTTFGLVAALLAIVAALASYLPARRAASVDPLMVLRDQ